MWSIDETKSTRDWLVGLQFTEGEFFAKGVEYDRPVDADASPELLAYLQRRANPTRTFGFSGRPARPVVARPKVSAAPVLATETKTESKHERKQRRKAEKAS